MAQARDIAVVGPEALADAVRAQGAGVTRVPVPRDDLDDRLLGLLVLLATDDRVAEAGARVAAHLAAARPEAVAVAPAGALVGAGEGRWVMTGGPPRAWEEVHDAVRAAVCGACILEGWADDTHSAAALVEEGDVRLLSTEGRSVAVPGAMALSPSSPCWSVRDAATGCEAAAPLLPAGPAALWRGRADDEALGAEHALAAEVAPGLAAALRAHGPLEVRGLLDRAREMGDDGHGRTRALSLLVVAEMLPALAERAPHVIAPLAGPMADGALGLGMLLAAARAVLDGVGDAAGATVLVAAAGDGAGGVSVRLAGLPDRWFAGRATPAVDGVGRAVAHLGDTPLVELAGLAGPVGAPLAGMGPGGGPEDAARAAARHAARRAACVADPGGGRPPLAIDARACVEDGVPPVLACPAIARDPAGPVIVRPMEVPLDALEAALSALVYALEAEPAP